MGTVVHMDKFSCDGCWTMAVARARSNDGRVDKWYEAYHKEMHHKGEPEVQYSKSDWLPSRRA